MGGRCGDRIWGTAIAGRLSLGRLTSKQKGKLGAHARHGTEIPPAALEAMADELLKGTPEAWGVKTKDQLRHAARKERPRGETPIRDGRNFRQLG